MPGLFSRIKIWGRERLRYSDLNSEFNNIINNMDPTGIGSDSPTVSAMRADTDVAPYSSGVQVESLPTSLDDEFQGLRFAFRRFFGGSYWYTDPGKTLTANPGDMVGYLSFDGTSLNDAFAEIVSHGGIINAASFSVADFSTSNLNSSNKKFGEYSYELSGSPILAFSGRSLTRGSVSLHFRNTTTNDYLMYNPLTGVELYFDGSGFLVAKIRQAKAKAGSEIEKEYSGSTITGVTSRTGSTSFQHVAMRWAFNGGAALDSLGLLLAGNPEGTQINAGTLNINPGDGGVWFIGAKKNDPATWDHFSAMAVVPDAEAVNPWTGSGAGYPAGASVANGVLTLTGVDTILYTNAVGVSMANLTVDVKFQVQDIFSGDVAELADIKSTILSRRVRIFLTGDQLKYSDGTNTINIGNIYDAQYHLLRVTTLGSPNPVVVVYLDGKMIYTTINSTAYVTGTDNLTFGYQSGGAGTFIARFEWVAYHGSTLATVYPPVIADTSGQIDDVLFAKNSIADNVVTQLVNNSAKSVYGSDSSLGAVSSLSRYVQGAGAIVTDTAYIPFHADGKSSYLLMVQGRITGGITSFTTILDGAIFLGTQTTVGAEEPLAMTAKLKLAPGLHIFSGLCAGTFIGDFIVAKVD